MRISDWSSDVCSSDLAQQPVHHHLGKPGFHRQHELRMVAQKAAQQVVQHRIIEHWRDTEAELSDAVPAHILGRTAHAVDAVEGIRSEEHTSELQSLMRISYAVFFLKKKNTQHTHHKT